MNCPTCQTENPDEARFCSNCGASLRRVCPNCSTEHPLTANFCTSCGERLAGADAAPSQAEQRLLKYIPAELLAKLNAARSGHAMAGERRVVTMLFCDVKGSTAAAESLDPEEWAEIMNGAFEHLIAPVYRYEGTLARLMGDAVLAFFGAPMAHEDDPERAVLAGLTIVQGIEPYREQVRQRWGLDFNVRVGINTGLVVVGEVGSDLRVEYTAMGDAVNLAARMEQTAEPGTVQIAEQTYQRVAALFDLEPLGEIEVKGKAAPVAAYRVIRRKPEPGRLRGIQGLQAPLVGRVGEMERLRQPLEQLAGGRGGIACLIGEAGLGKSRMIQELRRALQDQPHGWFESRGASYEASRPYGQVQQQLRNLAGIREDDPPSQLRQKLAKLLTRLPGEQRQPADQALQGLFHTGAGSDQQGPEGQEFKRLLVQAHRSIWRAQAQRQPTVLVFDDLHWADSASVELLADLFQLTDCVPLFLLCAFRPDRNAPSWQVKLLAETDFPHRYAEIALQPLSLEGSRELVDQLLSVPDLPTNLHQLIQQRAEGNPFFVEEVVRTLIEDGVLVRDEASGGWKASRQIGELELPDNLQGLLISRIDRLDGEVRNTLQLASVIGRSFYYRVLQAISEAVDRLDQHLSALQRVELILEAAREPDLEYAFRHALTQEAAYRSILRKQRRRYHLRVGEALERLYPERREELAPLLVHHFGEAGDPRASEYARTAADVAFRLYAVQEAIRFYRQALEAADGTELELRTHLYTRLGRSYELCDRFDEALRVYDELRTLAVERSAGELELIALNESAKIYSTPNPMYDPHLARQFSDRAVELAQRLGNREAEARVLWNRMNSETYMGEVDRSVEFGLRSLALAERHGLREQLAFTTNDLARMTLMQGDPERAAALQRRAQELWQELDNLPMLADNHASGAMLEYWIGDFERAIFQADESYRIAKSIENLWGQAIGRIWGGLAALELGRLQAAIELLSQALADAESAETPLGIMFGATFLALAYTEVGDLPSAAAAMGRAMVVERSRFPHFWGAPLAMRARIHLRQGELTVARQALQAERQAFRPQIINMADFVLLGEGELALADGRPDQAVAACDELLELARRARRRPVVPEALLLKAKALLADGHDQPAGEALGEASREAEALRSDRLRWQIDLTWSQLEARLGRQDRATALAAQARSTLGAILEQLSDPALRQSFEARADVRQALAGASR